MKKLLVLVFAIAMVCSLAFAFNVSADEGTTNNIASEATVTTPTTSWWITGNLDRLTDGKDDTGMHSSCHDRETTVNFKFDSERNVTKIVMKVNGTATTTAQNKTDLNAATEYKITINGKTTTLNALDKRELVIEVNDYVTEFSIYFISNWSGDNALIREVEVYEYVPPVVEAATGKNIEDEATIKVTDGNDYIKNFEYLVDNDPSTGLSAGNAASWINYHFLYEKARAITKVVVVVNSTGTMYNVNSAEGTYVHETMSNLPNIFLRLYDSKGNIVYKLENVSTSGAKEVTKDGKTYMEFTFDLGGALYEDVTKVEVATVHNKDTKLGVWEVEIFDFQCQKDEDHKYLDATCSAPATCMYCGVTTGEPSGEHTLLPANCGKPARCQFCDYTEGEATGEPHQWLNASYTAPKTCKVCGTTEGDKWVDSDLPAFVRGPENDTITYDDIVGEVELIAGSTGTGDPTFVLDGEITLTGRWGGPTGSQIKITLKNEWEITDARIVIFANWASMKISFYAADGTLLGEQNQGGLQANSDLYNNKIPETIQYTEYNGALSKVTYGDNDKAVKYIVITNTADKWGWVPAVYEVYFSGRERIPSNCSGHVFEATYPVAPTCTTEGTMVNKCTKCGEEEAPVVAPALGHNMGDYTVKVPATCTESAVLEYACTRCNEVIERPTYIKDVTDYADIYTAGAQGAGGYTTSHQALYDNNMESYLHASGGWYVESWIDLDMPYYITSVTVWTGSWGDNNSWEAYFTFYYQAPGSDEWVTVSPTKAAGVIKAGEKYEHTLELAEPVYADAVKIRVDRLCSFQGQAWEAEVAGTLFPEVAPNGHTWEVTEVNESACDVVGYTVSTCTVCGDTKSDNYTKALAHVWANATCLAPKTCTVCEKTEGDALAHEYVPGEPAENGAVTYTCKNGCNDAYVINNAAINGTYYADAMTSFVFENGVLTANGETYNYTFNETTGTLTVEGLNEGMIAYVNGKIVFRCKVELHTHDNSIFTEVTKPTCGKEGYTTYICQFCGPLYDADRVPATGKHSYVEADRTETKVNYVCTECGDSYSEDIITHTHTEVEIPAVRPTPSVTGYTAGVKCSECGDTIVAPVAIVVCTSNDKNFKINSATLSLGEDIGVTYNATHPANSDADSMYMVFVFDGKEFVVESAGVVSGNRYRFVFKGMRADLMTANIEAYVYAIEDGNYVMKSHLQYSVKQYCVNQLKKTINDDFKNLIFSVLNLGDCTQLAVNSETPAEKLVSNVVTAETGVEVPAIAVETIDPAYNVQAIIGDRTKGYDWKSGGIALGSSVQLKLQFVATEVEGLVLKFDVAGQRTIEIDASELELGSDGRYTVYFQVKVLEYDDTITCTFEKDGAQVGSTLTYSVYTYLVRSYKNTKLPEADRNFMKALYEYAEAVKVMNAN